VIARYLKQSNILA